MKMKYTALIAMITLLLALVIAIWFDQVVVFIIIQPITYLGFIFRLMFGSFHQSLIWGAFILMALIIPLLSLAKHMAPASKKEDEDWDYPDRVYTWSRHIRAINTGEYLRISLEDHLADLIVETISFRDGVSTDDILNQFRAGNLKVPPEVHNLLVAGYQPSLMDEKTKYKYHPDKIIEFLEMQMDGSPSE